MRLGGLTATNLHGFNKSRQLISTLNNYYDNYVDRTNYGPIYDGYNYDVEYAIDEPRPDRCVVYGSTVVFAYTNPGNDPLYEVGKSYVSFPRTLITATGGRAFNNEPNGGRYQSYFDGSDEISSSIIIERIPYTSVLNFGTEYFQDITVDPENPEYLTASVAVNFEATSYFTFSGLNSTQQYPGGTGYIGNNANRGNKVVDLKSGYTIAIHSVTRGPSKDTPDWSHITGDSSLLHSYSYNLNSDDNFRYADGSTEYSTGLIIATFNEDKPNFIFSPIWSQNYDQVTVCAIFAWGKNEYRK